MEGNATAEILKSMINDLDQLEEGDRNRILRTLETYYHGTALSTVSINGGIPATAQTLSREPQFSNRVELSPKEFIFQKSPTTDIERVVCLAYYLTHYRSQPHFKTIDISKLNTDAAQLKFSNASFAVENAAAAGLLVSAGKGNKQLSLHGERYVDALPDRLAAKEILASSRKPRSRKKSMNGKATANHKA